MVGVEGGVVEVEEAQPVPPRDGGVAAYAVVLVAQPHQQDDVERRGRILVMNQPIRLYLMISIIRSGLLRS